MRGRSQIHPCPHHAIVRVLAIGQVPTLVTIPRPAGHTFAGQAAPRRRAYRQTLPPCSLRQSRYRPAIAKTTASIAIGWREPPNGRDLPYPSFTRRRAPPLCCLALSRTNLRVLSRSARPDDGFSGSTMYKNHSVAFARGDVRQPDSRESRLRCRDVEFIGSRTWRRLTAIVVSKF